MRMDKIFFWFSSPKPDGNVLGSGLFALLFPVLSYERAYIKEKANGFLFAEM